MNLFNLDFDKKTLERRKRIVSKFIDDWNNFIFYIDTREQNHFIGNKLKNQGLQVKMKNESRAIKIGDIGIAIPILNLDETNIKLAYELKADLGEVINNIEEPKDPNGFNRFERELQKATINNYQFKYICRDGSYKDIINGTIVYSNGQISNFNPKALIGKLKSYEGLYNLILQFLTPEETVYDIAISFKYRVYNYLVYHGIEEHFETMKRYNKSINK